MFSQEFYKHLCDAIHERLDEVEYDDEANGYPEAFNVDGYDVCATVYYDFDLHDESFDHAFGTWHDPCPYMYATDVTDIDDVKVYVEETDEEVEGFDYQAFMDAINRA
jgi:hypothetical protein